MTLVYVDTGALIALNDRSDKNHPGAVAYFRTAAREATRFVLGRPVLVEYLDGVTKRIGKSDALARLRQIDGSALMRVEADSDEDHLRAREIFVRYDDQTIDMTDSLSFAIMERLRLGEVFSFDPDFEVHGFRRLPARAGR
jgi:predicted nucleic acid-binding protein